MAALPNPDLSKVRIGLEGIKHNEIVGSVPELAANLEAIQRIIAVARDIEYNLTETLVAAMEADTVEVSGIGRVNRKARTSSQWIDDESRDRMFDDATRAMIQRLAIDPMTGEVHPPLANTVRETVRLVQESFSISGDPKAGFRKVLGLQPDEYRSKYVTGWSVAIEQETI